MNSFWKETHYEYQVLCPTNETSNGNGSEVSLCVGMKAYLELLSPFSSEDLLQNEDNIA